MCRNISQDDHRHSSNKALPTVRRILRGSVSQNIRSRTRFLKFVPSWLYCASFSLCFNVCFDN